jgi:hypothetical protein
MIVIRNTNLEVALGQMFRPPGPQQTLTLLYLFGPEQKDPPPRGLGNLHQTMRKIPAETAHAGKSLACPYFAPSSTALWKLKDLSRYSCVSPGGSSESFSLACSLTLRRLHIRGAPHWVNICTNCLRKTSDHQELGCQEICASPSCCNKTGKYHISIDGCPGQRNDEVTIIKYGLVCDALGLRKKCRCLVSCCVLRCTDWLQLSLTILNNAVLIVKQKMNSLP